MQLFMGDKIITEGVARDALNRLDVDELGLDNLDRRYLHAICNTFDGGPVGIETMAAALSEERHTLEDVHEPYLLQKGLIQRTPRGRVATRRSFEHLGLSIPRKHRASLNQDALFDD